MQVYITQYTFRYLQRGIVVDIIKVTMSILQKEKCDAKYAAGTHHAISCKEYNQLNNKSVFYLLLTSRILAVSQE